MALHQLLSMIPHVLLESRRSVIARWLEASEFDAWDAEPDYGAFVDEKGHVVSGNRPARAHLGSEAPHDLVLSPETARKLGTDFQLVFLDWAKQPLSWEEIFKLWESWDSQGKILDCGSVSVPWSVSSQWTAPGWVAFASGFDGQPLSTRSQKAPGPVRPVPSEAVSPWSEPPVPHKAETPAVSSPSFLARAKKLKGETFTTELEAPEGGNLPMLPFTLTNLKDASFRWPQGVA